MKETTVTCDLCGAKISARRKRPGKRYRRPRGGEIGELDRIGFSTGYDLCAKCRKIPAIRKKTDMLIKRYKTLWTARKASNDKYEECCIDFQDFIKDRIDKVKGGE